MISSASIAGSRYKSFQRNSGSGSGSSSALRKEFSPQPRRKPPGESLAKDLVMFFRNDQKDICIRSRGQEFWANRVFLCARSSVFKVMLESKIFNEGTTKVIEVNDFEPNVVENLLDYISTDTCEILRNGTMRKKLQLYVLADKYALDSLARKSRGKILSEISKENVLDALDAAEKTNCLAIKKRCMETLQSLRGAEVLSLIQGEQIWDDVRDTVLRVEKIAAPLTDTQTPDIRINCSQFDTIDHVKRKIKERWEVGRFAKLVFCGAILDDYRTVEECGLFDGCVIFLLESGRRKGKLSPSATTGNIVSLPQLDQEELEKENDVTNRAFDRRPG